MSELNSQYYERYYSNLHYKGLLGIFTNGYHKKIENKLDSRSTFTSVLEIGGGGGEHLRYVEHNFSSYILLDIVENKDRLKHLASDPRSKKIKFILADASEMPFSDATFDRVIATCVLHHIPNLETALKEIRRVSKKDATIDLYVPCDPGMLYRWIRHWTSHFKQKRSMGVNWRKVKFLWATEHRNHYLSIQAMCKEIFAENYMAIQRYPLKYASWNFNLFTVIRIRK